MKILDRFTIIVGLKNQGKSNLLQHILSMEVYENHLVYDTCREHDQYHRYVPKYRKGDRAKAEAEELLSQYVVENRRDLRPDVVVIDEINRIAPNKGSTPEALMDLADLARHYDVGVIGTARRPAQMDTTLFELADNLLVFKLKGQNDKKKLRGELDGLGELAESLPRYHFAHVNLDRDVRVIAPVPEYDTTGEL